jgi:hypothetical protein
MWPTFGRPHLAHSRHSGDLSEYPLSTQKRPYKVDLQRVLLDGEVSRDVPLTGQVICLESEPIGEGWYAAHRSVGHRVEVVGKRQ